MAKTGHRGGRRPTAKANVDWRAWKDHLRDIIERSPRQVSNRAIARHVQALVGKNMVSESTVHKWRSPEQQLVPSDATLATALVDALERLGAFSDARARDDAVKRLIQHLGYQPVDLAGQVFLNALRLAHDDLLRIRKHENLDDYERATCAACLVSQQLVLSRVEELPRGSHVVLFMRYDSEDTAPGERQRRERQQELREGLFPFAAKHNDGGVVFDVVLCVCGPNGAGAPPLHGLATLARDASARNCRLCQVTVNKEDAAQLDLLVLATEAAGEGPQFWCWRLIRHPTIANKLARPASTVSNVDQSSQPDGEVPLARATTFLSMIEPGDIHDTLFTLGLKEREGKWIVTSEPISDPTRGQPTPATDAPSRRRSKA